MASLQEFLEVLADAYPDEQVRGKEFEPFLRDALVASPSHQFTNVWLWVDWPGRDGPDRGIDLVAEDLGGGYRVARRAQARTGNEPDLGVRIVMRNA